MSKHIITHKPVLVVLIPRKRFDISKDANIKFIVNIGNLILQKGWANHLSIGTCFSSSLSALNSAFIWITYWSGASRNDNLICYYILIYLLDEIELLFICFYLCIFILNCLVCVIIWIPSLWWKSALLDILQIYTSLLLTICGYVFLHLIG